MSPARRATEEPHRVNRSAVRRALRTPDGSRASQGLIVDVSSVALPAERAVEESFTRLGRYLAYAPISSDPGAKGRLVELAGVLAADLDTSLPELTRFGLTAT